MLSYWKLSHVDSYLFFYRLSIVPNCNFKKSSLNFQNFLLPCSWSFKRISTSEHNTKNSTLYTNINSVVQVILSIQLFKSSSLKPHPLDHTKFPLKEDLIRCLRAKTDPLTGFLSLERHPPKVVDKAGQCFTLNKNNITICF